MKKIISAIFIALVLSCNTTRPLNSSLDDSSMIRVDCRNDRILHHTIYQFLRSSRAKDITTERIDSQTVIMKAVYLNRDISPERLEIVAQDIRNMAGVVGATVEENRSAVLQVNERAPLKN